MDTLRRTVVRSCGLARQLSRQQGARSASSLHPHNQVLTWQPDSTDCNSSTRDSTRMRGGVVRVLALKLPLLLVRPLLLLSILQMMTSGGSEWSKLGRIEGIEGVLIVGVTLQTNMQLWTIK